MNENDNFELNGGSSDADAPEVSENDFDIEVEDLEDVIRADGENNKYPYSGNTSYPYGTTGASAYSDSLNEAGSYERGYAYSQNSSGKNNKKKGLKGTKLFAVISAVLCLFLVIVLVVVITGDPVKVVGGDETTTKNNPENAEEFSTSASYESDVKTNPEGELMPKAIYNKVLPSSVGIMVYTKSKTLATEGSGVLFQESKDGKYTYIITCAHVIKDATGTIRIQLSDSSEYEAVVVGYDARTDIGVLRIEKTGLQLADIGDSSKIAVGDSVYAIGNPGGVEFANSFTNGMVSALDRPVSSSSTGYTTECIQHTAAINPGNSGGALVNSFGQVIGINSMKIVDDEYEGMGFSVPSSVFVEIVNDIMKNGYVANRPKLGITIMYASEYSTYGMFVALKGLPSGSIVIYGIESDSALLNTNVKVGDMIIAVNGTPLDDREYLAEFIEESNVGDVITLSIVRINSDYSSEEFEVSVPLIEDRGDSLPEEQTTASPMLPGGSNGGGYSGSYEDFFNQYFG